MSTEPALIELPAGETQAVLSPAGKFMFATTLSVSALGLASKFSQASHGVPIRTSDALFTLALVVVTAMGLGQSFGRGRPMIPWLASKRHRKAAKHLVLVPPKP